MENKKVAYNRLSQEQVIEQFKEVHGDEFDYSKVVYVGTHTPVEVYCKKHDYTFFPTPKNHKNGAKCKHCGRESQIEKAKKGSDKFVEEMFEMYGDNYDLSNMKYINSKTEIEVICKHHGLFLKRPCDLLTGTACIKCGKRSKTKSKNKDKFIEEAKKVYADKDDYTITNIISAKEKINIRCKKHDLTFTKDIATYLSGYGCPECSAENYSKIRTKTTDEFIQLAKAVHEDNCDYTDTMYTGSKDKVKIKCNIHNEYFETLPSNHLAGGKCRKCLSENISEALKGREGTCGYTRSAYIKQANGREACVYLIKCFDENEEFYKIGKTFLNINKRFTKSNMSYAFEVSHFHFGEAGYIYDLEKELHKKYKPFKYKPINWFAGHTECFIIDLPIKEIKEL